MLSKLIILMIGIAFTNNILAAGKKCLLLSSYHYENEWTKEIIDSAKKKLDHAKACEYKIHYMDTIRKSSSEEIEKAVQEARTLIDTWKPDVTLAYDDNASKYLITKYYKDTERKFIFGGVNWSVDEYNFPFKNVTGMIEVAPIKHLVQQAKKISKAKSLGCITSSRESDIKMCDRIMKEAKKQGLKSGSSSEVNFTNWQKKYNEFQDRFDVVVVQNKTGIEGWDDAKAKNHIVNNTKKLTIGLESWMSGFNALTFAKKASEQGEYTVEKAVEVLKGKSIDDIPIVPNREWDVFINEKISQSAGIKIPGKIARKAKKVD